MPAISENLKLLRQVKGMTQENVATMISVTRQTVSSYESGRTQPDLETLKRLATVYGADIRDVLYGENRGQRQLRRVQYIIISLTVVMLVGLLAHSFLQLIVHLSLRAYAFVDITSENVRSLETRNTLRYIAKVTTAICTGIFGIGLLVVLQNLIQVIHAISYRKIAVFFFLTIIVVLAFTVPFAIADDVPGFAEYTLPILNIILISLFFLVIVVVAKLIKQRYAK